MLNIFSARPTTEQNAEIDRLHSYVEDLEATIGALLPHTEDAAGIIHELRERDIYTGETATEFAARQTPLTGVLTGKPGVQMPAIDSTDPRLLAKTRAAYTMAWQSMELGLDLPSAARLIRDVLGQLEAMPARAVNAELVETIADVLARQLAGEPVADMRDEHADDYREAAAKVAALFDSAATARTEQGV